MEHLQERLRPGGLYSAPARALHCAPLAQRYAEPAAEPRGLSGQLHLDVENDISAADDRLASSFAGDELNEQVFFRVVANKPSRAKQVKVIGPQQQMFTQHDLCIVFHDSHIVNGGAATIVGAEPVATYHNKPLAILSALDSNLELLHEGLKVWSRQTAPEFYITNRQLTDEQRELVTSICNAKAFAGAEQPFKVLKLLASKQDNLEMLRGAGIVDKAHEGPDSTSWRLNANAFSVLALAHRMVNEKLVFAAVSAAPPLQMEVMTAWEMFHALRDAGWEFLRAPKNVSGAYWRHTPKVLFLLLF